MNMLFNVLPIAEIALDKQNIYNHFALYEYANNANSFSNDIFVMQHALEWDHLELILSLFMLSMKANIPQYIKSDDIDLQMMSSLWEKITLCR